MKLYLIKNNLYCNKKVAAENMEQALSKYREYLKTTSSYISYNIDINCTSEQVFKNITECKYLGEYDNEDVIK